MLLPRVIPCLLLQDGMLVKTVKFKNPRYIGNPINAIKIYNEKEVDELVILDIEAYKNGISYDIIENIADECFMPLAYGGGIKTVEEMRRIFNIGVEKVVLNREVFLSPTLLAEGAAIFGHQSLVVSIDVKKDIFGVYRIYDHSRKKLKKEGLVEWCKNVQEQGAGEILLSAVDREGTWTGLDLALFAKIREYVQIPIILNGGAGDVEHIKSALKAGVRAVGLGSMVVYQKKDCGVLINFPHQQFFEKALPHG